jgi:hypothetical protein
MLGLSWRAPEGWSVGFEFSRLVPRGSSIRTAWHPAIGFEFSREGDPGTRLGLSFREKPNRQLGSSFSLADR